MTRIFTVAALGGVIVVVGILGQRTPQLSLKEQYLERLRTSGRDFINIARRECVYDAIEEINSKIKVEILFDIQEVIDSKSNDRQQIFDRKWGVSKEKKEILLKVVAARRHCEQPEVLEAAALTAARHTQPLVLVDWTAHVSRTGLKTLVFASYRIRNPLPVAATVLDGSVRLVDSKGREIRSFAIPRGTVLSAGATVEIPDRYPFDGQDPLPNAERVRAILTVKRLAIGAVADFVY